MQEICIILQASTTQKPKYEQKLLRQMYIFNITAADFIF